jgi:hypothetical protein
MYNCNGYLQKNLVFFLNRICIGLKMDSLQSDVEKRMQSLVDSWELAADQRAVFLRCYWMMTENMLKAIQAGEFFDGEWVGKLLNHFAGYYFSALEVYDFNPPNTPPVWRIAFDTARNPAALVLHHLLLGINAHITYDLVLTLIDLLSPEWLNLSLAERQQRYADYTEVNAIIGRTIDAVQDTIVEPEMPLMDIVDKAMGPVDEWMISHLISHWRDHVWQEAIRLMETGDTGQRNLLLQDIESRTMDRAAAMLGHKGLRTLSEIW